MRNVWPKIKNSNQEKYKEYFREEKSREFNGPKIQFRMLEKDRIHFNRKEGNNKVEKILKGKTNRINVRLRQISFWPV